MLPKLHLIGGPTASGKTAAALKLARQAPSVIINADAMQVYEGLPLLTAQPTKEEKAQAPHELFEIFDPSHACSAGQWLALARAAIEKAAEQNKTPILVGGTGLYFHVLLNGLAKIPPIPDNVRKATTALYDRLGHDAFREALAKMDPESAKRITLNDRQRLCRAYDVAAHTGKPLGEWQKQKETEPLIARFALHRHKLMSDRQELYAKCDARFVKMIESGAMEEVRALLEQNLSPDLPSMKILGVRELAAHLRGDISLDEAITAAQQVTRNYAKRQMTWFRNQWKEEA